MFSLQRILGREDKFFTLLEASADQARTSVKALVQLTKNLDSLDAPEKFAYARQKDREITDQIREAVVTTFITALEREDIAALAEALNKIPKTVEKFSERILAGRRHARDVDFSKQISLLERSTDVVLELVQTLRRGVQLDKVKDLNDKLQFLESEADKHMVQLYTDLFEGQYTPVQLVLLKDLYELLEKLIDRCRDVGNVISQIALKNS